MRKIKRREWGEDIIGSIMVGFRFYLNKSDYNFSYQ